MKQNNILLGHPAHLWIGETQTLKQELIKELQRIFCKNNGCEQCVTCEQIQTEQFYQALWINPQESYSIDHIDEVLEQVRFKLDIHQHKFFIFCRAEELSSACSNRLLKTIEEPHAGYHFIFLATRTDTILPTVISRCLTKEFKDQSNTSPYQEIIDLFIYQRLENPLSFFKLIDKFEVDTQNSKDIIDQLFAHFYYQLKHIIINQKNDSSAKEKLLNILIILKKQFNQLPAAGSTKIFWKNLFIDFHFVLNA